MTQHRLLVAACIALAWPHPATAAVDAAGSRAFLDAYCVSCHNQRLMTGGLELETVDVSAVGPRAEVWEKVVRKLRARMMPPPGAKRPDTPSYSAMLTWLQGELDGYAAAHPNPGRKDALHRLNRTEYQNVVRDLLAVDVDVSELLPVDNPSHGFDNIAGTLTLNDSLMEQYLSAAQTISSLALGTAPLSFKEYRVPYFFSQDARLEHAPPGTRGGLRRRHPFPQDGEYLFEVKLMCGPPNAVVNAVCDGGAGFLDAHDIEVTVDGERVGLIALPAKPMGRGGESITDRAADRGYQIRVPLKAGPHDVAVWFLSHASVDEFDGIRPRFERPAYLSNATSADWQNIFQPAISSLTIGGPYNPSGPGDTPSRRRVLVCRPSGASAEHACARRIALSLAERAYRRTVTPAEVDALLTFYDAGRADGFEGGIELMLRRLLTSTNFLFRIERDRKAAAGTNYRVSDAELASRLSFFFWGSMPDDELRGLANQGRLSDRAVLARQVKRMLADDRSEDMLRNFAGQWLQLRKVEVVAPNAQLFPNFDDSLRADLRRETELFVDSIRRDDRGLMELLTADYSFLNERLARHYGVRGVTGSWFRRVSYGSDTPRRGLLGQGSILTLTSSPIRTRPVVRGKWILENLLGTPPPAPPANVPPLAETGSVLARTMRERMAAHRANAVCASCHAMIDPLGFALENFNPVGQYRTVDDNFTPIDASGVLPDGVKFDGLAGFRADLVSNPVTFVSTVTEKLLTYALGRGLEPYDMPAVRRIVHDAAASHYRFSSVILGIVNSLPFQMRRASS